MSKPYKPCPVSLSVYVRKDQRRDRFTIYIEDHIMEEMGWKAGDAIRTRYHDGQITVHRDSLGNTTLSRTTPHYCQVGGNFPEGTVRASIEKTPVKFWTVDDALVVIPPWSSKAAPAGAPAAPVEPGSQIKFNRAIKLLSERTKALAFEATSGNLRPATVDELFEMSNAIDLLRHATPGQITESRRKADDASFDALQAMFDRANEGR